MLRNVVAALEIKEGQVHCDAWIAIHGGIANALIPRHKLWTACKFMCVGILCRGNERQALLMALKMGYTVILSRNVIVVHGGQSTNLCAGTAPTPAFLQQLT